MIPCCPKQALLFANIQSYNEQNPVTAHDCDKSDMIQIFLYTSNEISELEDIVFNGDGVCDDDEETTVLFETNYTNLLT